MNDGTTGADGRGTDERGTDEQGAEEQGAEEHPTDEEQTEREWHFWLGTLLLVGGGILIVVQPEFWPPLGFVLVALAVVAWITKTIVERGE